MKVDPESQWNFLLGKEIARQSDEWDDNIKPELWAAVLMEEAGEIARAILEGDLFPAREEIVQVAAICHRMYHSLERAEAAGWRPTWQTEPRSKQ